MNETKNPPIVIISNIRKLLNLWDGDEGSNSYIEAYLRWEHGETLVVENEGFRKDYAEPLADALYFLEHGEERPRPKRDPIDYSTLVEIGKKYSGGTVIG